MQRKLKANFTCDPVNNIYGHMCALFYHFNCQQIIRHAIVTFYSRLEATSRNVYIPIDDKTCVLSLLGILLHTHILILGCVKIYHTQCLKLPVLLYYFLSMHTDNLSLFVW